MFIITCPVYLITLVYLYIPVMCSLSLVMLNLFWNVVFDFLNPMYFKMVFIIKPPTPTLVLNFNTLVGYLVSFLDVMFGIFKDVAILIFWDIANSNSRFLRNIKSDTKFMNL